MTTPATDTRSTRYHYKCRGCGEHRARDGHSTWCDLCGGELMPIGMVTRSAQLHAAAAAIARRYGPR